MDPTWNALDQGVTASRREDSQDNDNDSNDQSEDGDRTPTQQSGKAPKTLIRGPGEDDATDGTTHGEGARTTTLTSGTDGKDARPTAYGKGGQLTTTDSGLINGLYKRLMVVIQRLGRGDASVTDQQLARVTQKLRGHGLSVYIA